MNEAVVEPGQALAGEPSAGALLRQAREAAGVHLAALAVSLKVPPRQLEALEADRLELLPDNVFARALAASICRNLKVDPQPVLARLPHGIRASEVRFREPINEPFRVRGEGRGAPWARLLRKPPVMVALALLVGALVLIVAPSLKPQDAPGAQGGEVASPSIVPSVPESAASAAGAPGAALRDPAIAPTVLAATVAPAPGALPPMSGAAASTQPTTLSPMAPAAPRAAAAMQIQARAAAWVQVSDATGNTLVRRTLAAGETLDIPAAPAPLAVTIGSAATTTVAVRGKPIDMTAYTRDNVARFEVK